MAIMIQVASNRLLISGQVTSPTRNSHVFDLKMRSVLTYAEKFVLTVFLVVSKLFGDENVAIFNEHGIVYKNCRLVRVQ